MFDNIGEKIKKLATITTVLGIIASCISGLVVMFEGENFFLGLLTAALGSLGAWVGSFLLYGFGELVESSMESRDYLAQIRDSGRTTGAAVSHMASATPAVPATDAVSQAVSISGTAKPAGNANSYAAPCRPTRVDSLRFQCPKCQTVQMNNRTTCSHCGVRFY